MMLMRQLAHAGHAAILAGLIAAAPAYADVKAGVDAWSRGDYRKAVEEWRPAAVAGDPDAQFDLGQAYKLGRGVPVDLVLAEQWYGKAAVQGHIQASDNYGLTLFQNGKREEAVPWLEKSVARGEPRAQLVLGTMLFNGDVVKKDWVRAYALMVRASSSGLPQGSRTLAQMDEYIPADVRQQGIALARQYEAQQSQLNNPPQIAGQGSAGDMRGTELPASTVATDSAGQVAQPTKAPPPSVRTTPPRAATAKGWRFQVGAFRDEGNARRLWQQMQARVASVADLQPYYTRNGALTGLQIGPLGSRADVTRVCEAVRAKLPGTPCVIIAP